MKEECRVVKDADSFKSERGLTLIEVLIVVFIISIILAILVPNYSKSTEKAQEKLCFATEKMVEAQMELYRIDVGGEIASTEDLYKLVEEGYLKELPVCPAHGEYRIEGKSLFCSKHGHYSASGATDDHTGGP